MHALRFVSMGLILGFLAFPASAEESSVVSWKTWAEKASKADMRAMLRYLEDERAQSAGVESLLGHHDRDVRGFAVLALGRMLRAMHPGLVGRLEDIDAEVRRTAAFAIGQIGSETGEKALLERLRNEEHREVRREIWKALGRIGTDATLRYVAGMKPLESQGVLCGGLILSRQRAQTDAKDFIVRALSSASPSVVAAGYYGLSRSRKDVADRYKMKAVRALESIHHGEVRRATIKLLAKGAGKAGGQVSRLLKSRPFSGHERAALAMGIAKIESSLTERRLIGLLRLEVRQLRSRDTWRTENIHPALVIASKLAERSLKRGTRSKVSEVIDWLPRTSEDPAMKRRLDMLRCELNAALRRLVPECSPARAVQVRWRRDGDLADLLVSLKAPKAGVRTAAWSVLAEVNIDRFAELLEQGLADTDLVVAANIVDRALSLNVPLAEHDSLLKGLWKRAWKAQDIEVLLTLIKAFEGHKSLEIAVLLRQAADSPQLALRQAGEEALHRAGSLVKTRKVGIQAVPQKELYARFRTDELQTWRTLAVDTEIGRFEVSFLRAFAPVTVAKIGALFKKGFYQGLSFHRVVPNFVVQGGDPRGDGWGGPGATMRCENNPIEYEAGTVGMALAGKDTGGSQFFVSLDAHPHLLGTYTVFGRISKGFEVVKALVPGDRILSSTLSR